MTNKHHTVVLLRIYGGMLEHKTKKSIFTALLGNTTAIKLCTVCFYSRVEEPITVETKSKTEAGIQRKTYQ